MLHGSDTRSCSQSAAPALFQLLLIHWPQTSGLSADRPWRKTDAAPAPVAEPRGDIELLAAPSEKEFRG